MSGMTQEQLRAQRLLAAYKDGKPDDYYFFLDVVTKRAASKPDGISPQEIKQIIYDRMGKWTSVPDVIRDALNQT